MNPRRTVSLLCLLVALSGAALCGAASGEEEPAATARTVETPPAEVSPPAAAEDQEEDKQRRAMAGLLALCGILIGGLMFVVLVMVWGARLRRLARRELPRQTTLQNEHWFLKPPKENRESRVESPEPDSRLDRNSGS